MLVIAAVASALLSLFAELLESSKRLPAGYESAAFLVENGGPQLVYWPRATEPRQTTFRGAIPRGTIAIAHTHPELSHLRMPSAHDRALARRTRLDIYVITRAEVWVATPDGRVMRLVSNGSWSGRRPLQDDPGVTLRAHHDQPRGIYETAGDRGQKMRQTRVADQGMYPYRRREAEEP